MDQTLSSIVDFIISKRTEPPPDAVRKGSREILVDSLGCAIGGRNCIAARMAGSLAGRSHVEAGALIGSKEAAPIDIAAFWNTAMIRYLDFNDALSSSHPSDMIGALVATSRHANASGKDMLDALAISYEILSRLSETVLYRRPWTLDQGYAVCVGAVGGMCHLLELSRDQTTQAISFAATNGTPLRASRAGSLSDYKGVATAVSSRHAVFCLHMARFGMTGPSAPFEGRHGIVELMHGQEGPLNLPPFDTWRMLATRLKYFPVANNTQIGIWAAIELRKQVEVAALEKITLRTSSFLKHESGSEPAKWDPKTRETADHSLPYIFARALQEGTVNLETFEPNKIGDPHIRELMNRVIVVEDPAIDAESPAITQLKLEAVDRNGKTYHVHVRNPRGSDVNPLTHEEIAGKFKYLTEPFLGPDGAAVAFDRAWRTEEAESFASVLEAFLPDKAHK